MSASVSVPKFPRIKDSLHSDLKKRVNQYFSENEIKQTGNASLYLKAFLLTGLFAFLYVHLLVFQPVWYFAIPQCILLGCLVAAVGFNVMHDGSHGSFSAHKWQNKIAGYSISMLGASHFMWNIKHNMVHHSFTNVDGVDDDIEIGFMMRFAPTQKRYMIHRFQYIYFALLYMFMYVFWVFYSDYVKYFSGKIGAMPLKKMKLKEHVMFWVVKIYHALIFVVLPIMLVGFLPWLLGFFVASFVAGFILSIVFQLAHTVEDAAFPVADTEHHKLPDEFAAHQIKTTANFATGNKMVSWLLGGLNFQVEHHLFPKISHIHYPEISKIVKSVCAEHGLHYIEYPTMRKAVLAHVRFLKEMGHKMTVPELTY
jgi:linoleoyl-CoA desaturase